MGFAENTGRKNDAKNRHLGTILQLCRAISSQLRHVSTIGKKLVKQQYLLHMSPQYGELRPTSGWDHFGSLGHPSYFQRLPHLGSITARQSISERQPNFAALNRGRHLCSSRWALAHISSSPYFAHQFISPALLTISHSTWLFFVLGLITLSSISFEIILCIETDSTNSTATTYFKSLQICKVS